MLNLTNEQIEEELRLAEKRRNIERLQNWFDSNYTKYEQMFIRRKALGIQDEIIDDFRNKTYHNITELYEEAEIVASEIRQLR